MQDTPIGSNAAYYPLQNLGITATVLIVQKDLDIRYAKKSKSEFSDSEDFAFEGKGNVRSRNDETDEHCTQILVNLFLNRRR